MNPYVITWEVTDRHGWGLIGVHLSLHLINLGRDPLLTVGLQNIVNPKYLERITPLAASVQMFQDSYKTAPYAEIGSDQIDVIHGLGNDFIEPVDPARTRGKRNIGMIFFEEQKMTQEVIHRAKKFDGIVVGSTYNRDVLANAGLENVHLCFQGIDPFELVSKRPSGRFEGKFVVFSGGKLEYRKGQDLVLAAFKIFHERHPESLLVTNWVNFWPQSAVTINQSNHLECKLKADGAYSIEDWAVANGIEKEAFVDLGLVRREDLSQLFADVDVAVFPNRCEGGTNLVCNETMFCRVPTILSANTGHLDMMPDGLDICIPLLKQSRVPDHNGKREGWGESDIEEIVEALEWVYQHRDEATKMGRRAASFVGKERTWQKFAKQCVDIFDAI
jgi:glycosyltransferase involved in cell wall biosynthesis